MAAQYESEQGFLPHEVKPVLVPPIEDKEAEQVDLARAIKERVNDFLEGVNLHKPDDLQFPDKYRTAEVSYSEFADLSKMNMSDLGSKGVITLDGQPDLVDADVFVNGVHMASRSTVISGRFGYSETASKHSSDIVLSGNVDSIHQLNGLVNVLEVDNGVEEEPRIASTEMTITVFTFKDGRTRTLFPHSAWGQPFPEEQKIDAARQLGVVI